MVWQYFTMRACGNGFLTRQNYTPCNLIGSRGSWTVESAKIKNGSVCQTLLLDIGWGLGTGGGSKLQPPSTSPKPSLWTLISDCQPPPSFASHLTWIIFACYFTSTKGLYIYSLSANVIVTLTFALSCWQHLLCQIWVPLHNECAVLGRLMYRTRVHIRHNSYRSTPFARVCTIL